MAEAAVAKAISLSERTEPLTVGPFRVTVPAATISP